MTLARNSHGNTRRTIFERQGFLGPLPVLTGAQCELLVRHLNRGEQIAPAVWEKGRAITDYLFCDLATQPQLLGILRLLLGEHIILWGASVQSREPQQVHPWHTDIETSRADMRSVSVWIGIENTSLDSSLHLMSGSHRFGCTVQEVVQQHGLRRGQASAQMIEAWAKENDRSARLVKPDMTDGEAIIFDGRLWHGSENGRPEGRRTAVLLQYASADELISLPDLSQLEWPFRFHSQRAPILTISGTTPTELDDIKRPPSLSHSSPIAHVLHEWTTPPQVEFCHRMEAALHFSREHVQP